MVCWMPSRCNVNSYHDASICRAAPSHTSSRPRVHNLMFAVVLSELTAILMTDRPIIIIGVLNRDSYAPEKACLRAIQLAAHTVNNDATLLPNNTACAALPSDNKIEEMYIPGVTRYSPSCLKADPFKLLAI